MHRRNLSPLLLVLIFLWLILKIGQIVGVVLLGVAAGLILVIKVVTKFLIFLPSSLYSLVNKFVTKVTCSVSTNIFRQLSLKKVSVFVLGVTKFLNGAFYRVSRFFYFMGLNRSKIIRTNRKVAIKGRFFWSSFFKGIAIPQTKSTVVSSKVQHKIKVQPTPMVVIDQTARSSFISSIFKPTPLKLSILAVLIFSLLVGYSVWIASIVNSLPSPQRLSNLQNPTTTEFYDKSGELLYRLYEGRNRTLISVDELPKDLINATVAIEDKHFFKHPGVDLFGIGRSVFVLFNDGELQGGSTITQQLIKNTLLSAERTWERKLKEIVLALWAETIYTKHDILQMYFNESPYGGPAWGVEAASQMYFNKSARKVSLAEAAYIAGLPASPTIYSPFGVNPKLGIARQHEVLRRMLEDGYITSQDYEQALKTPLEFASPNVGIKAPHFVMYLRSVLSDKYGERTVSQGGLKVFTTLDLELQEKVENLLAEEISKLTNLRVSNGAVMVVDPRSGYILSLVGSKDYFDSNGGNFNVALALRQPGSSIKPITYATGFKQGYTPGTILLDTPVTFKNAWESYSPVNYDGKFHGAVTIRTALGSSYNIPAVKMLAMVGIPNMIQTAKDLGITTFNDSGRYGLSLTLGGGDVKLIDMMSAYSVFAQNGVKHPVTGVVKIVDSYGTVLEDNTTVQGKQVLSPAIAYLINNILADNNARTPAFGVNSLLNISGHTVAVKTGTTDNKRDNWTFGYTPDVVVGVWVGNNDNTPMDPHLASGVTGAAPIWNKVISHLLEGKPNITFSRPSSVIDVLVDGRKDLGISGQQAKSAVAQNRKKEKDGDKEKEVVTFTDPFSTFVDPGGNVRVGR